METQPATFTFPPAHKAFRGGSSSLDVSNTFLLTFNGNSVVLRPHSAPHQSLILNHISDIAAAKFSHDGQLLASIDVKGTLIISQPIPDRIIQVYLYENVFPNAKYLDWSADKKKVCIVGQGKNKFAKVIGIETGVTAGEIGAVSTTLNSCSFRPQRPYKLVMGGDQHELKCYDGPPYSFTKSNKSHTGYINHVRYSSKGTFIVSGGSDRRLVIYDGKTYDKITQKQNAHDGSIYGLDWIDDEHFVTCSSDKVLKIWNSKLEEKYYIQTVLPQDMKNPKKYGLYLVVVKAHKQLIYVGNINGDILVYHNPLMGKQSISHTFIGGRSKIAKLITFSNDWLILLDSGGKVMCFNPTTKEINAIALEIQMNNIVGGYSHGNNLFINGSNGSVWVYQGSDPLSLKLSKVISEIEFMEISRGRNSSELVGVSNNKIMLYDVNSNKVTRQVAVGDDVTCLQSNQHFIIVGSIKGKVYLYNYDFKLIETSTLNTFKITTLSLFASKETATYRCLMGDSCGKMGMVQISQKGFKAVKESMGGHNSMISGADADDKWLYTFSMDGKVCVWGWQTLMRDRDIKDTVNGGILGGISMGKYIVVTGNDMVTKMISK